MNRHGEAGPCDLKERKMELPDIEDVVQVFKDRGLKAVTGSKGADPGCIEKGCCCAIPAAVLAAKPGYKLPSGVGWYEVFNDLFSESSYQVWQGFDRAGNPPYTAKGRKFGKDLRERLIQEGILDE